MTSPYDIAHGLIGVHETPGLGDTPLIMEMLSTCNLAPEMNIHDETPWCSAFVNYVVAVDPLLPRSHSLAARSWLSVGTPILLNEAVHGYDIVILNRPPHEWSGHVGFFHDRTREYVPRLMETVDLVWLLAGNQGNAVSIAPFPASRVIGVRRLKDPTDSAFWGAGRDVPAGAVGK